jgi:SAM-dependent methyltransferase
VIDRQDYGRHYADQYAHGEFEPIIARVRLDKVLRSVSRYAHSSILEVGCGFEPLFPYIAGWSEYWIVEPLPDAVAAAQQLPAVTPAVHILEGLLESRAADLPDQVDFVIASSLLHEVPDPDRFVQDLRRHCGPETVLHLNVPNVHSFHRLLALEAGLIQDVFERSQTEARFQRQTRFDMSSLRSFLEERGFEVLDAETYFVKPFTHSQLEQMLAAKIIDGRIIDALDRMIRYMPDLGAEMFVNVRLRP